MLFTGQLYKKQMLTELIMPLIVKLFLVNEKSSPNREVTVSCLCGLIVTIGRMIDHEKTKKYMGILFKHIGKISQQRWLPGALRFALEGVIALRANSWVDKVQYPGPYPPPPPLLQRRRPDEASPVSPSLLPLPSRPSLPSRNFFASHHPAPALCCPPPPPPPPTPPPPPICALLGARPERNRDC